MGDKNKKDKKRANVAKNNGVQENLFTYAAGGQVTDHLESTQINKFATKGGTGFAAEDANALNEKLRGVKVEQVGTNNHKNGADRIADGVHIQTKYFDTANRTVNDAFDANGMFRYPGMQLEVPSDQYDKAISLMREKIAAGKVPGVTNPDDAATIVKKGSVTYQQAKNIARAGNLDSLWYDTKNNAVTSGYAFAIGFSISFARAKWNGMSTADALNEAVGDGLHSTATSFIAGVATSQLLRSQSARVGTVAVRKGVRAVAKTEWGKIAVEKLASASAGKPLYGAAATNHLSKALRTNVITGAVTTLVVTSPDVYRAAISGNTSWAQVGKNFVVNGSGVAAGTAGWMGGAAAGAAVGSAIPLIGTAVGAVVGGIAGSLGAGAAGSYLSKKLMDQFVEDDAVEMLRIVQDELPNLAVDFLLTDAEFSELVEQVSHTCTEKFLRQMYAQESRSAFVRSQFDSNCLTIIKGRKQVALPAPAEVEGLLEKIVSGIDLDAQESYVPDFILVGPAGSAAMQEQLSRTVKVCEAVVRRILS